jgi:acyl carrier protein
MDEAATFERLRTLIAEVCEVPAHLIRIDARIGAYALDSVKETELLCAMEDAFAIEVDDDELKSAKTVADLVQYVERQKRGLVAG